MYLSLFTWFLTVLSVVGSVLVIKNRVSGLMLWCVANTGWIAVAVIKDLPAQVVLFAVYLAISAYGVWDWRRKAWMRNSFMPSRPPWR